MEGAEILAVENMGVQFHTRHGVVHAVGGVSFRINRGDVLGVVGESGSGKSVMSLALMGLLQTPPAQISSGRAMFRPAGAAASVDLLRLSAADIRSIRGNRITMIFQEPMTSLNPYMKIGDQLIEILTVHGVCGADEARARAIEMLDRVGIPDPSVRLGQYPHEYSGGMRQRVMIAMALLAKPDVLIADEPTTALDVTIQAQILDLIRDLKKEFGMAVIFISHAMGVVAEMSDRILVMYAGRAVEQGTPDQIFRRTAHPYTRALIDSMPDPAGRAGDLPAIKGMPPDPSNLPAGCAFEPRCPHAEKICSSDDPADRTRAGETGHRFRCHVDI